MRRVIIVAYDFTERSVIAMEHALILAKKVEAEIHLLNIVDLPRHKYKQEPKLEEIASSYQYEYGVKAVVLDGDITTTISRYADSVKALMVVLGSRKPVQGWEKLFGSKTLKVVMGGDTPFLITQEKPAYEEPRKILFPIDVRVENKEKLRWVSILSSFFDLEIELFVQQKKNEEAQVDIRANLLFATRYLDRYKIKYSTKLADSTKDFEKEILERVKTSKFDLIMIMTSKSAGLFDCFFRRNEEYILMNKEKVPVLFINPRIDLFKYSGFFS